MAKNEELNLAEIYEVLERRKWFIIKFTLILLVLAFIFTLILPKTYESESIIQLGFAEDYIYSPQETTVIIQSSDVIKLVIDKFSQGQSVSSFIKNNLDIKIVEKTLPYIKITTKANDKEKAKEINEELIQQFFSYVEPQYKNREENLKQDLQNTESNIKDLENNIQELAKEIPQVSDTYLSEERLAKIQLLRSIIIEYKNILREQQARKAEIETKLNKRREYKIVNYPEIPEKAIQQKMLRNLAIALITGLLFSIFLVLLKEAIKKK